jgi:sugar lactone lactonase YvrE
MVIKKVFAAVLLATLTACNSSTSPLASQTAPIFSSSNATVQGSTVEVRIETGTQLKTLAAKKTIADVDHYHIKLINTTTGVVMAEGDATDLVSFFQKVPNGTYKVNVDALDATGNSIVQGGAQDSANTVTVAAPSVTYSDGGPCLKVRLKLLNATGEKVGNNIIVEDGDEWSGTPELQPGGNCNCAGFELFAMTAGHLYTVLGSTLGNSGDGGSPLAAQIQSPEGVGFDADGNLYTAESGNRQIRVVPKTSGEYWGVTMQAYQTYTLPFSVGKADAKLAFDSSGNLYFTSYFGDGVYMVPKVSGTYFGIAMTVNQAYQLATLTRADGITLDGQGNVFATSMLGNSLVVIPKVAGNFFGTDAPASTPTQIAAVGMLDHPGSVVFDASGNLYVADVANQRIRMLPKASGAYWGQQMTFNVPYTIAGGGTAGDGGLSVDAVLNSPLGIRLDAEGNLLIADSLNHRVRMVTKVNGTYYGQVMQADHIYTIAGTGQAGFVSDNGTTATEKLNLPIDICPDTAGTLFIADTLNNRVRALPRGN